MWRATPGTAHGADLIHTNRAPRPVIVVLRIALTIVISGLSLMNIRP